MNRKARSWLVIAVVLIVMGTAAFTCVLALNGWNFRNFSTTKYETNAHDISAQFQNIAVVADTADITFRYSQDGKCSVVCYEAVNETHAVSVKGDTLTIELVSTKAWYEYIQVSFDKPKITVYLPQDSYGSLSVNVSTGDVEVTEDFFFESMNIAGSTGLVYNKACAAGTVSIRTSTGDIWMEQVNAGAMELSVSTGNITVMNVICQGDVAVRVSTGKAKLENVQCKNLVSTGNTGNISLKNVIAQERLSVERSTGDVEFNACDALEIVVKTDTGDVQGTLLSPKVFVTRTDTGKISTPNTLTGGKCEVTTSTGDIRLDIP